MSTIDRRHFLHAGALAAAGLAADARHATAADKAEDKKPKFRCGLVTYNLAAALTSNFVGST